MHVGDEQFTFTTSHAYINPDLIRILFGQGPTENDENDPNIIDTTAREITVEEFVQNSRPFIGGE